MKYLKFFENISNVISEIEDLKYILEDEGFVMEIVDQKQYMTRLLDMIGFSVTSPLLLTKERNSIKKGTHFIWIKSESDRELGNFFESEEFLEFFDRLKEICEKYNYLLKYNIGYSLKIEPKN